MYFIFLLFSLTPLNVLSNSVEDEIRLVCGIDDKYLNGAANVWYGFRDLENSHAIADGEAIIIEYSMNTYCLSEEYEEIDKSEGVEEKKLNSIIRRAGFSDRCSLIRVVDHSRSSPLEFLTEFETRIYATRIDGVVTVWFKYRDKGALIISKHGEQCV